MRSSVADRLESWRAVVRDGEPDWLVEEAPRIVAQLEAELAMQHNQNTTDAPAE